MATDPCFLFRYLIDHSNISTCRSGIAAALDIAAIAWGIAFVIPIIDPDKYSNAAKRLIEEDAHALDLAGKQEASAVLQFFSVCGVSVRRAETPHTKGRPRSMLPQPKSAALRSGTTQLRKF